MQAKTAYEILDQLAEKSNMFCMIRDEFQNKNEKINELESKNEILEGAIMELTIILSMMTGGN
jgi:hypothetical protein